MRIGVLGVSSLALAIATWSGLSWAETQPVEEAEAPAEEQPGEAEGVEGDVRANAEEKGFGPLAEVPNPRPSNLSEFVRDEQAAIALGKALFWDAQAGSDAQACASCHFHAGADPRVKNQLSPGLNIVEDPERAPDPDLDFGDAVYGLTASGAVAGSNYTLVAADFPFHRLEDPEDRNSCHDGKDNDGDGYRDRKDYDCFDMNDSVSSQGTFGGEFDSIDRTYGLFDECDPPDGEIFNVDGDPVRKVEPRNTLTVINAVFNHRNFWDGRASNIFNGVNPLGERGLLSTQDNPYPGVLALENGYVRKVQTRIDNASLASQAVGPPTNNFEMSCAGRTNADIGRKLLGRAPLAFQKVHSADSVLAQYRASSGVGLVGTYEGLIRRAFEPKYWVGEGRYDANGDPVRSRDGFRQIEVNFPLFLGLAVQLYEATLVSDQTPFDDYMAGDEHALDDVQKFGLETFLGAGKCVNCHVGSEFTGASVRRRANQPDGNEEAVERMVMGDGGVALYDGGFYNIGVRPTFEDLGLGAEFNGFPLAFSRQLSTGSIIDDFNVKEDELEVPGPVALGERVAVDGAFKVPGLRNVELTGPYFHNGGRSTLAQVVAFYNRGGDRINLRYRDTTGFGDEDSNLDPDIQPLGLDEIVREIDGYEVTAEEALVEFLLALTDERVRYQQAPFDHPELKVPNGHPGDEEAITSLLDDRAADKFLTVPAVGAAGSRSPLGTFLALDPQDE